LGLVFVAVGRYFERVAGSLEPRDGVQVRTYCEPGLAALASPELLHETLAALVENAVSHTDAGTIRLNAVANNGQVALSVTDSGRGILPEFHSRVFEPFYRIGDDGKGYGLGLAIAAQAVAAMDGEIEVSAGPQGGTMFTVTLRSATVLR
jgi:two-component system sensor histidine kinase KdpD